MLRSALASRSLTPAWPAEARCREAAELRDDERDDLGSVCSTGAHPVRHSLKRKREGHRVEPLLDAEQGPDLERKAFERLLATPPSQARRSEERQLEERRLQAVERVEAAIAIRDEIMPRSDRSQRSAVPNRGESRPIGSPEPDWAVGRQALEVHVRSLNVRIHSSRDSNA